MNERLTEELTNILRDSMEPRSGLSREQLKTLALELAAAMPPVEPADDSLQRQQAWDTANKLASHLHQLSSVIVLLGEAHRMHHENQEQVSERIWGNAFDFLSTVAEHASDQVEEILRGAFPRPPNAFKTAEKT